MFCSKCGKENNEKSKFCVGCGDEITKEIIIEETSPLEEVSILDEPEPKATSSKTKGLILLGVLLLSVAVIIVVVLFINPSKKATNKEVTVTKETKKELKEEPTVKGSDEEYIFPHSDTIPLTEEEVAPLSEEQLSFARNEIIARHGRIYSDEPYSTYFNSKSWYKGTKESKAFDANYENELNDVEKSNIEMIKRYEQPPKIFIANEAEAIAYVKQFLKDTNAYVPDKIAYHEMSDRGYRIQGYNDSETRRTTCFWYDVSENGHIFNEALQEYVKYVEDESYVEKASTYYGNILSEYKRAENNGFSGDESQYPHVNRTLLDYCDYDSSTLYYAMVDLANDGVPELFISQRIAGDASSYSIMDIYGYVNNTAQHFTRAIGTDPTSYPPLDENETMGHRAHYFICKDGVIKEDSSGGAMVNETNYYQAMANSLQLKVLSGVAHDELEITYPKRKDIYWRKLSNFADSSNQT